MGLATYEIIGSGSEWHVRHDGKDENVYDTKVAAFEHAVNAASIAKQKQRPISSNGQVRQV